MSNPFPGTLFATCINCAHKVTMLENNAMIHAVGCPKCRHPQAFGAGVFIEDFEGYTWEEAERQRERKKDWEKRR